MTLSSTPKSTAPRHANQMTIQAQQHPTNHLGLRAQGGARLCGSGRTADSVYLECGVYLYGTPVEQHLMDPPQIIDPVQFSLSAQGIKVTKIGDTKHIVDLVGAVHYPEPCDFIEEARNMGISRKIPLTSDVRGLSSASTLLLVHSRAGVVNAAAVSRDSHLVCPNGVHHPGENCAGLHWVRPGTSDDDHRVAGGKNYEIIQRRSGDPEAIYTHAIFMAAPLTCVTVIRDHHGRVDPRALAVAQSTGLPVNIADA